MISSISGLGVGKGIVVLETFWVCLVSEGCNADLGGCTCRTGGICRI